MQKIFKTLFRTVKIIATAYGGGNHGKNKIEDREIICLFNEFNRSGCQAPIWRNIAESSKKN